jgi:hypothetical protein
MILEGVRVPLSLWLASLLGHPRNAVEGRTADSAAEFSTCCFRAQVMYCTAVLTWLTKNDTTLSLLQIASWKFVAEP